MKKLEKRVERELVDILYSIIKSITYNPSSVTIKVGDGLDVIINKVMNLEYLFPLHTVLVVNKSMLLLQTTLIINPYEKGYTIQSLQFKMKQRLKEKRKLVRYLKRR